MLLQSSQTLCFTADTVPHQARRRLLPEIPTPVSNTTSKIVVATPDNMVAAATVPPQDLRKFHERIPNGALIFLHAWIAKVMDLRHLVRLSRQGPF